MKKLALLLAVMATPAAAASGPFFALDNTNFVVLLSFLLFLAVLIHFGVPGMLSDLLDKRASGIKSELDEARALREEAQTLLASYERKQQEVKDQADRIIAHAREEAKVAAEEAKADLAASIERRIAAAQGQIESAQDAAVREVRDTAVKVAVAAARDVVAKKLTAAEGNKLIEDAIGEVGAKLH